MTSELHFRENLKEETCQHTILTNKNRNMTKKEPTLQVERLNEDRIFLPA
jgi:hypothetical protein